MEQSLHHQYIPPDSPIYPVAVLPDSVSSRPHRKASFDLPPWLHMVDHHPHHFKVTIPPTVNIGRVPVVEVAEEEVWAGVTRVGQCIMYRFSHLTSLYRGQDIQETFHCYDHQGLYKSLGIKPVFV